MLTSPSSASITPHSQACPAPLGKSPTGAALCPWDTLDRAELAVPTQGPCSSHPAAVRLCQRLCHALCPVCGCSRTFPGSSRSWQGPPTPRAGPEGDGHSGGCRRCPPGSPRRSPTPERAGWSPLQQFIICKTSLGSTPSNLGFFLIAGICSARETGGGQRHGRSGICPGVPLGQLVKGGQGGRPPPKDHSPWPRVREPAQRGRAKVFPAHLSLSTAGHQG